jgi:hypothetical protein
LRPDIAIVEGETEGDGIAAQIVASMTGSGYANVWLGGKRVDDDVSSYGYGGDFSLEDFYDDGFDGYGW